ncbi:type II secretion system protein GspL [Xanthomonas melonis]|uniref:Type II secretion system protein L n=1 Tax=Xanthomonas melonis TaxID=56456 RepID=A0A2S7DIW6_9XANT|nr:type II secretion system protein GspL [Xanthomonas melonis]MCC4600805.1 type II secretion system protein GspL [Xanthomonas melonis]PPU73766.1 type II secretion system protein GspL [Xanthomonas melonis]
MMTTLVLLPAETTTPPTAVRVDAQGQVVWRGDCSARTVPDARNVLVVPGVDVHLRWMALPGRSMAQSVAAARLQLAEHLAVAVQTLHVAIATHADADGTRLVAAVDTAVMQRWLERAASLGIVPDAVVPDCLLLPEPAADQPPALLQWDGRWLLRGSQIACSLEPPLAQLLIATLPMAPALPPDPDPQQAIAQFARQAVAAPLDLRQKAFAPTSRPRAGMPTRRLTLLFALLLLSPVVLSLAQTLRYEIAAQLLQRRTAALPGARDARGASDAAAAPAGAIPDAFAPRLAAVFSAVEATPGVELDALTYQQSGAMRLTLLHADAAQLQHLAARLRDAGWQPRPSPSQPDDARIRTIVQLEPPR